jgi:hypothetical protein
MSLPSLAFGESTLDASLLIETGPSTARDASTIRELRVGEMQARSGERFASVVNPGGGGRRRDSRMVEKWIAEVAKV